MTWTCSSSTTSNCATIQAGGPEPGDPPERDADGNALCISCARALGHLEPTYQDPSSTTAFPITD